METHLGDTLKSNRKLRAQVAELEQEVLELKEERKQVAGKIHRKDVQVKQLLQETQRTAVTMKVALEQIAKAKAELQAKVKALEQENDRIHLIATRNGLSMEASNVPVANDGFMQNLEDVNAINEAIRKSLSVLQQAQ